ncbi:MAG: hypothetical protein C4320_00565 [Armatimonadota bacterium]
MNDRERYAVGQDLPDNVQAILRAALAYAEDAVVISDPEGKILGVNNQASLLVGHEVADVLGKTLNEETLQPLLDRVPNAADLMKWKRALLVEPGRVDRAEHTLENPHREYRRYSGPLHDVNGAIVGRLWSYRDITDERRQQTLSDRLYAISVFVDSDPRKVCSYIAEVVSRLYQCNCVLSVLQGSFLEYRAIAGDLSLLGPMVGSPVDQTYEQFPIEALGPVEIPDTRADPRTRSLLPTRLGYRAYLGVPIIAPDGTTFGCLSVVSASADTVFDQEDARFLSLVAARVATEIERERFIREELVTDQTIVTHDREEHIRVTEVLNSISRAFQVGSHEDDLGQLLMAQAGIFSHLLGFENAGLVLSIKGDQEFVATDTELRIPAEPRVLAVIPEYPDWLRRERIRRLGLQSFGEVFSVPFDAGRAGKGAVLFGSSRRMQLEGMQLAQLEAVARQLALGLEARLQRTELIAKNSELAQHHAEVVLAEQLRAIGNLSAVLAHDIKNIQATLSMVISSPDDPVKTLSEVRLQLDRFTVLTHRLLANHRPRMVSKQPINIFEVIQGIVLLMSPEMRIAEIQVIATPPKLTTLVRGDRAQLEHLLVNVLQNSLQAMSAVRGGMIEIKVRKSGRRVALEIRDSGPGITAAALQQVFDPFFSTRHQDLGLGLYAARRIAREHGDILMKSDVGLGTTVTVVLQAAADL